MMFDKTQAPLTQLGYLIAEASRTVVFVVGAGVSAPAGVPLWRDFQSALRSVAMNFADKDRSLGKAERAARKKALMELKDPWLIGDKLEEAIPQESYDREIRRLLRPNKSVETYEKLWSLNPSGIISFNLDALAKEALNASDDQFATSLDTTHYEKFLLLSRPFLFQPHGDLTKKRSWILGAQSRNRLLKTPVYRNFIRALLSTRRLVIVGLRPEDIAFQTLLNRRFSF